MSVVRKKSWSLVACCVALGAAACGGKESGTGPAADYTLALAPEALRMIEGGTGFETVTITRTNFTGAVTLSLGNAPAGVTGSFEPAGPTGTSSTLTVSVAAAVAPGVYNLTVDGTATARQPLDAADPNRELVGWRQQLPRDSHRPRIRWRSRTAATPTSPTWRSQGGES